MHGEGAPLGLMVKNEIKETMNYSAAARAIGKLKELGGANS